MEARVWIKAVFFFMGLYESVENRFKITIIIRVPGAVCLLVVLFNLI